PAATQQMMSLMGQINALSLLQWATSLASSALIVGAVFRAVLEPQNRRWFFLRLGRQEFWLALCLVVVAVVAGLLAALSMFPIMITSLVLVAAGPTQTLTPGVGLGLGAMVLIALGAMLWLRKPRRVAIGLAIAIHAFGTLATNVWFFSAVMIACVVCLMPRPRDQGQLA
ncbi:MAG: hypothetical protein JSS88_14400, partial [Actinobacteria bacterium]|nr:hypothetical protein [Actinomycetota bacterium]